MNNVNKVNSNRKGKIGAFLFFLMLIILISGSVLTCKDKEPVDMVKPPCVAFATPLFLLCILGFIYMLSG